LTFHIYIYIYIKEKKRKKEKERKKQQIYIDTSIYHICERPLSIYEGESKIICNVGTCRAIGYTAGWA
jgi:hypothetical protein